MPTQEDLEMISDLIFSCEFAELGPAERFQVYRLAIDARHAQAVSIIALAPYED